MLVVQYNDSQKLEKFKKENQEALELISKTRGLNNRILYIQTVARISGDVSVSTTDLYGGGRGEE